MARVLSPAEDELRPDAPRDDLWTGFPSFHAFESSVGLCAVLEKDKAKISGKAGLARTRKVGNGETRTAFRHSCDRSNDAPDKELGN